VPRGLIKTTTTFAIPLLLPSLTLPAILSLARNTVGSSGCDDSETGDGVGCGVATAEGVAGVGVSAGVASGGEVGDGVGVGEAGISEVGIGSCAAPEPSPAGLGEGADSGVGVDSDRGIAGGSSAEVARAEDSTVETAVASGEADGVGVSAAGGLGVAGSGEVFGVSASATVGEREVKLAVAGAAPILSSRPWSEPLIFR
jgi:hypothetical protein